MTPAELDRLAAAATPGPYYVALDDAEECGPHKNSGLSLVDTGRTGDWPIARLCETQSANLIAACSPEVILKLLACIDAADAMRDAFGRDMGHWPPLGWTPVTYDAARAALKEK